jgi:uncharacterized protein YbbK (DUF523 family)
MIDKILISACLLGNKVRYDGKIIPFGHSLITRWRNEGRLVSICPEVEGGLLVPRAPAEINPDLDKVITIDQVDVTDQFTKGASKALALCLKLNIRFAILKESSPSCGSSNKYDGSFSGIKVPGEGLTTKILREHGVTVFSENNFTALKDLLIDNKAVL